MKNKCSSFYLKYVSWYCDHPLLKGGWFIWNITKNQAMFILNPNQIRYLAYLATCCLHRCVRWENHCVKMSLKWNFKSHYSSFCQFHIQFFLNVTLVMSCLYLLSDYRSSSEMKLASCRGEIATLLFWFPSILKKIDCEVVKKC